jgi:uncharacterized protein (DUF934 family)
MKFLSTLDTAPGTLVLDNTADVEALRDTIAQASRVVLQFPKWVDGRAYSQARLLRARLRFTGAVCATGEVLADMLPLLARSGFDEVQLHPGQSEAHARAALGFFAGHYQGDVTQPQPLFSRAVA